MKTSAELQQQSFFRKLVYFGLMLVLFTGVTFSGRFVSAISGAPSRWTVSSQSRKLQLNESDQGQADLAGSTARLALSGARGFAICFLWISTIEKQKKHEWNEVELLVNTITKLQPHFLTPWLFQSWNLAYNVSVESDRVRDKYFYISRGIELLADGERINRARGVDDEGHEFSVGNPDMRFWIGFYYMNKFGNSDEQNTLRSLLQLSCINPAKRDAEQLRRGREIDPARFREFVQQNPILCRRLRDYLRCDRPEAVVDFLADNAKVPSRYAEVDGAWQLKRRAETQFPVLPDQFAPTSETASPHADFGGNFDSYRAAWAWHVYAQEPLPPVIFGKPAAGVPPFDRLRFRLPRAPAGIIFRQQPSRSLSYIAERLMKEGWFDDRGWTVDEGRQTDKWFPDEALVVGNDQRYSSEVAWQAAYQSWDLHGKEHGFLLSEAQIRNLRTDAKLYRDTYGLAEGMGGPELQKDQVDDALWRSYDANRQMLDLSINQSMTNFRHFLYRAEAEKDPRTVQMRRSLFEADRLRRSGEPDQAIRRFHDGFISLVGDPATGKQGLLEAFPHFRQDSTIQEELIEKEVVYLNLLDDQRSPQMRGLLASQNALVAASFFPDAAGLYSALLFQYSTKPRELPTLFVGPLEGKDSNDQPWVSRESVMTVKSRLGLVRAPTQPPMTPPGGGGPSGSPE